MQFFRVDPAAVRQLSAAFQSAALKVSREGAAFRASATLSGAAFGRLPEGLAAGSQYERKLAEAVEGLAALQTALEQVSSNLGANADTYMAADEANLLK